MITLTLKTEYPADSSHHIHFFPTKKIPKFWKFNQNKLWKQLYLQKKKKKNSENNFQETYTYKHPPTHPPEGHLLQKEHSGVTDTGWGLGNLHNLQAIGAYLIPFWKPFQLWVFDKSVTSQEYA